MAERLGVDNTVNLLRSLCDCGNEHSGTRAMAAELVRAVIDNAYGDLQLE